MSLFDEFQQWQIIQKPRQTKSYERVLASKKNKTKEELKQEWKELCKQKKAELSEEEFIKWRQKEWYKRNKERVIEYNIERYYRDKADEEAMIEEIYKNVYDTLPEPINYDKLYAEKYDADDRDWNGGFRFYRRASRLNRVHANRCVAITHPVRVYNRGGFGILISKLGNEQNRAYEYIKPHIDEIGIKDCFLAQEQWLTKLPMWITKNRMRELTEATDISKNQICSVASALMRDKYIASELYLWRVSFLIGDVIIDSSGHLFRPILENNLSRLTPETVEQLHQDRIDWLHRKNDTLPIYVLWDAYLIEKKINEREKYFYIVPT